MCGSSQAQKYHMRWFEAHLPADGSVRIRRFDMDLVGLSIAGPKSRDVLQQLDRRGRLATPPSSSWTTARWTSAMIPAMINRVTYTGDLGYEIWVAPEYQRRLYQEIMAAGRDLGIGNFGMRALALAPAREELPAPGTASSARSTAPSRPGSTASSTSTRTTSSAATPRCEEKRNGGKLRRVSHDRRCRAMPTCWATSRSGMRARSSAGSPPAATPTMSTSRWRRAMCRGLAGDGRRRLRDRDHRRAAQGHDHHRAAVRSRSASGCGCN